METLPPLQEEEEEETKKKGDDYVRLVLIVSVNDRR